MQVLARSARTSLDVALARPFASSQSIPRPRALAPSRARERFQRIDMSIIDILEANSLARRADVDRRRLDALSLAAPSESARAFTETFSASRDAITRDLHAIACRTSSCESPDANESEREQTLHELRAVNARVARLERERAEAMYYVSSHIARVTANDVKEVRTLFANVMAMKAPRRRFKFTCRVARVAGELELEPETGEALTARSDVDDIMDDRSPREELGKKGTRDRSCATIVAKIEDENDDYVLERLERCDVYVVGAPRALRAHDLRRCNVYITAVSGSVHVENVVDCVVHVASRQLRVHAARRVEFYARTTSRPIIEDSRDVAFAPFAFDLPGCTDRELKRHGLFEETGMWREVDDFNWLKSTPSPNWRTLDVGERRAAPNRLPLDDAAPPSDGSQA